MTRVSERTLEQIDVAKLKPAARNPRTHSKRQVQQIARSIERFGFTNPLLIDADNQIIAGHGRFAAATELGLARVPCVRLGDLTAAEKRAYIIADNKLALNAGWDMEILSDEFDGLIDIGFDICLTGFENAEVDLVLAAAAEASLDPVGPEDDHPQPPAVGEAVTRRGDLWTLGRHRLLCGDAKANDDVEQLMDGAKADMAFIDPPYNVPIAGHVSGLGRTRHREFVEASGEMSVAAFIAFLAQAFETLERACRSGAVVYVCIDWRHLREALTAGYAVFNDLKNLCVWSKTNGGMGTFYRSQHEMVLVWTVGDAAHTNNFGLGDKGRYRTNVWTYAGVSSFKADRMEELALHPTVKPVALVADAIRDVTHRGQTVLDTFGGSGTTLIAAEKTGRAARLLELDPGYCDVILGRWERLTGKHARLTATGDSFEAVAIQRCAATSALASAPIAVLDSEVVR